MLVVSFISRRSATYFSSLSFLSLSLSFLFLSLSLLFFRCICLFCLCRCLFYFSPWLFCFVVVFVFLSLSVPCLSLSHLSLSFCPICAASVRFLLRCHGVNQRLWVKLYWFQTDFGLITGQKKRNVTLCVNQRYMWKRLPWARLPSAESGWPSPPPRMSPSLLFLLPSPKTYVLLHIRIYREIDEKNIMSTIILWFGGKYMGKIFKDLAPLFHSVGSRKQCLQVNLNLIQRNTSSIFTILGSHIGSNYWNL